MQDIRELYILGQPIQTNIGKLHFIKVKDYHRLIQYIPYLDIEKQDIVRAISKIDKDVADSIKDVPFLVLIKELREVLDVYDKYEEMFLFLFKDDVFDKIENEEDFNYYKDLIRKMNNLPHEEKNPNPEIQYFNDLKKQLEKQRSNGGLTFEAIYTSVWTALGQCPDNMTIYQMYAMFGRVG
jgi:hypothetical protein